MAATNGLNHLGLAVCDLDKAVNFFVRHLGWEESGRDDSYPRSVISDGAVRLTLWQVDYDLPIEPLHRRQNIGLHHVALQVDSEATLQRLHEQLLDDDEVAIEFAPNCLATGRANT